MAPFAPTERHAQWQRWAQGQPLIWTDATSNGRVPVGLQRVGDGQDAGVVGRVVLHGVRPGCGAAVVGLDADGAAVGVDPDTFAQVGVRLSAQSLKCSQRGAGGQSQLRIVALGLEFLQDHQWKDDLGTGNAEQRLLP